MQHIYLSKKIVALPIEQPSSNFLFGGASIIKKDTFVKCGMFDENMFIGFEDTDLSLRLYNMGYKIDFIEGSINNIKIVRNS